MCKLRKFFSLFFMFGILVTCSGSVICSCDTVETLDYTDNFNTDTASDTSDDSETYVHGEMDIGQLGTFQATGTLARGGADYYGYCELKDDEFSFVVGSRPLEKQETTFDYYMEYLGIKGPPTMGVYQTDFVFVDDPNRYTTFSSAFLQNYNSWEFTPEDAEQKDKCYVQLFAEPHPMKNELTPEGETFDYFIKIRCATINIADLSGSDINLTDANVKLWFRNCNE